MIVINDTELISNKIICYYNVITICVTSSITNNYSNSDYYYDFYSYY